MKATELRIRNFVNLTKDDFNTVKPYQIFDAWDLYKLENSDCADIKPIPVTEEWLFNLSEEIKDLGNDIFRIGRFKFIWKHSYKYWYVVDDMTGAYMTKIEFVHEYQNFWYAMNGEELQLKAEAEKQ